jgi:hypothetical protein
VKILKRRRGVGNVGTKMKMRHGILKSTIGMAAKECPSSAAAPLRRVDKERIETGFIGWLSANGLAWQVNINPGDGADPVLLLAISDLAAKFNCKIQDYCGCEISVMQRELRSLTNPLSQIGTLPGNKGA